ncbi:predicted protein [Postia placenta Mad-698-R]|nr:predicted protein [Postia placenta Mad-698-R]
MSEKLGTEPLAVLLLTQVLLLHMETLMVHTVSIFMNKSKNFLKTKMLSHQADLHELTRYQTKQLSEKSAGLTYREAKLPFQAIRDEQVLQGADVFRPFESEEEWDLAKWLIKNVGHTQAEKFLKLPIIRKVYI